MSLDRLLETLERDARAEAERVLAAAGAEAEAIRGAAATVVARRRAEALSARERALRADAAVQLAQVRRRARGAVLDARHQLLERIRAAARERIAAAEGEAGSLGVRLQAALACHGDRPVEVRCAPALADAVRAGVGDRAGAAVAPDAAASDPLVVRAADGAMEVDAGLGSLFERHWPGLAVELVRELEAAR
jgi:vacuolar-type H+-ATPase subunit E/Vma4